MISKLTELPLKGTFVFVHSTLHSSPYVEFCIGNSNWVNERRISDIAYMCAEWSICKGPKSKLKQFVFQIPPIFPITCSFLIMSVQEKASPDVRTAGVNGAFPVFCCTRDCPGKKQVLGSLNLVDAFSSWHTLPDFTSTVKWGAHDKSAFMWLKVA